MTPAPSLIGLFVAPLNRAGIEYIEYVILSKPRYFRDGGSDRHLRDIARSWR